MPTAWQIILHKLRNSMKKLHIILDSLIFCARDFFQTMQNLVTLDSSKDEPDEYQT